MRAIVDAGDLYRALVDVERATPKRDRYRLPVLQNVLLTASEGRLTLFCTDLEAKAGREITSRSSVPGATTVPAKFLKDLARVWKDAGLMLLEEESEDYTDPYGKPQQTFRLVVMVHRFKFHAHIKATAAHEYPRALAVAA